MECSNPQNLQLRPRLSTSDITNASADSGSPSTRKTSPASLGDSLASSLEGLLIDLGEGMDQPHFIPSGRERSVNTNAARSSHGVGQSESQNELRAGSVPDSFVENTGSVSFATIPRTASNLIRNDWNLPSSSIPSARSTNCSSPFQEDSVHRRNISLVTANTMSTHSNNYTGRVDLYNPRGNTNVNSEGYYPVAPQQTVEPMYNQLIATQSTAAHMFQQSSARGTAAPCRHASRSNYLDPTTMVVDDKFAFCFDRGNGQVTRLVPADMLPPLKDVPYREVANNGMIVLPVPLALAPDGKNTNTQRLELLEIYPQASQSPPMSPGDPIQSALQPPKRRRKGTTNMVTLPLSQNQIDTIISQSPLSNKRGKIYCDKWVHDGVCAFTQQGCKYKHEMPHDRATQYLLGLFHGYPQWYKRHQAELNKPRDDDGDDQPVSLRPGGGRGVSMSNRLEGPWRRQDRGLADSPALTTSSPARFNHREFVRVKEESTGAGQQLLAPHGTVYRGPVATVRVGSTQAHHPGRDQDWGPIAPPTKRPFAIGSGPGISSQNPFEHLQRLNFMESLENTVERENDDDERGVNLG